MPLMLFQLLLQGSGQALLLQQQDTTNWRPAQAMMFRVTANPEKDSKMVIARYCQKNLDILYTVPNNVEGHYILIL